MAGFTGALLLANFAVLMAWESMRGSYGRRDRVRPGGQPRARARREQRSVLLLGVHGGPRTTAITHDSAQVTYTRTGRPQLAVGVPDVLADAVTSVLAILALAAGKWLGAWLDPLMGIVGAVLVAR
jgi:hypothetical protein